MIVNVAPGIPTQRLVVTVGEAATAGAVAVAAAKVGVAAAVAITCVVAVGLGTACDTAVGVAPGAFAAGVCCPRLMQPDRSSSITSTRETSDILADRFFVIIL